MVSLTENRHKISMENISQFLFTSIITYNNKYLQYTAIEAMQMGSEKCNRSGVEFEDTGIIGKWTIMLR